MDVKDVQGVSVQLVKFATLKLGEHLYITMA